MLKYTAASIAPSVTKLFNLSIKTGQVPTAWKMSSVVPIPKSSVQDSPRNYRPISLLSILSKVLERHNMHWIISAHLADNNIMSNAQWGFSAGKGTVTALLLTTYDWFRILEDKRDICAVFFDFSKAFDTVPHGPLLDKLLQLGLNEYVTRWITDYLTCRQQKVLVNGTTSDSVPVLSGVPQGSILGPLLFLIYVNSLASLPISEGSHIVLYADDLLLYQPISTQSDHNALRQDIASLERWSMNSNNSLQFNISKCKYMVVSRRDPLGSPIEEVRTFK